MLNYNEVRINDQNGIYTTAAPAFIGGGTNENVSTSVGMHHVYRFSTMIPLGATVTAATLRVHIGAKNGDSNQSVSYNVFMQNTGNAPPLVEGEYMPARPWTVGPISKTVTFTTGGVGWSSYDVDVLSMINTFMARPEYVPGAYIVFLLYVTAETGDINLNLDRKSFGGEKPNLQITYTAPTNGIYTDFNALDNGSGSTENTFWGENDAFGTFVTGGSVAIDNAMQRVSGRPSLKYTPPASNPSSKPAGVLHYTLVSGNSKNYIFCGWIYVPAAFTGLVYPQFMWNWDGSSPVTARDQWVPFCCAPVNFGASATGILPMIHVSPPFTGSNSIWLSDCAVYESDFKQMPFNTEKVDTKIADYNYTWNAGRGVNTRIVNPNTQYTPSNAASLRKSKKYRLNSYGIWQLDETTRRGLTWDQVQAGGKTWDQLQADGLTWDQLKAATSV